MATGTGLGGLIPVAMTAVAIVTMLRARARRRSGEMPRDDDFERRQAATQETERRMASYLAGRDAREGQAVPLDNNTQENGR